MDIPFVHMNIVFFPVSKNKMGKNDQEFGFGFFFRGPTTTTKKVKTR